MFCPSTLSFLMMAGGSLNTVFLDIGGLVRHNRLGMQKIIFLTAYSLPKITREFEQQPHENNSRVWPRSWTHEFNPWGNAPREWTTSLTYELDLQAWLRSFIREFDPWNWATSLTHEFDPRVGPIKMSHENDPLVWPMRMTHQFNLRELPTSMTSETTSPTRFMTIFI